MRWRAPKFTERWFEGMDSEATEDSKYATVDKYPSVRDQPAVVFAGMGRLAAIGEISGYPEDNSPPDPRVCPSKLIVKPDKVRVVHY